MNARKRLETMVRTDQGSTTAWSTQELREALDGYRDEVLAETAPAPTPELGIDWETTRVARNAIHRLRQAGAVGDRTPELRRGEVHALISEFDRTQALLADSWNRAADMLEATPYEPTELTGPAWYGQGWDDAVHHLRDLVDGMKP
ncbi:hypothetical protein ACFC58_40705 [Kitasatospora purpeofusca]|uniref:hypothetical protein n=1 Tax=Kitasatospora purpeofusca TaxID=67352 RepID=UPI0035D8E7CB